MPAAVPLLVNAAATAAGWSAVATSLATLGSALAVGAYEQKRAKQKARDAYNKSLQDRLVPIKSGVATRCYLVGTVRTSGPVMYVETIGPKRSAFDLVIAIANNECTLNGWYLNEDFVSVASFPGTKYGTKVATPTSDEFTVTGPAASVVLSGLPVTTNNAVKAVWRQGGATGYATITPAGGQNYNLSGMPSGSVFVTVSYSSNQADSLAAQFQEGSESQTASNWDAIGYTAPMWNSTHRLQGIANARALFQWEENLYQTGAPALGVVATGRSMASHLFYDPRDGSHPTSTKNPAILAGWWMTLDRGMGGCGIPSDWIDWQSISVAANICDELVPLKNHNGVGYTMAKRYECDALLDTGDAPLVNLETILSAMAGRKAFTGGVYKIVAGAFRPATITITDRDVVGNSAFTLSTGNNEDIAPNMVTAVFADSRGDWLETPLTPVVNSTYLARDGGNEEPLDLVFPATTDARRAHYLMGVALEGSQAAMALEITVGGIGEDIAIYDTVQLNLTNRAAYAGHTFEVIGYEDHWNGTTTLQLVEIRPQTWALDPDTYVPIDPQPVPDTSYLWNPPAVSGFVVAGISPTTLPDGTAVSRVDLAWDAMADEANSPNAKIELRYRIAGGDWIGIASVPGDAVASTITTNLVDGEIYQFQARYMNGVGAASAWVDAWTEVEGAPLPVPLSLRLRASSTIFRVPATGNALPVSITLDAVKTDGLTGPAVFTTNPSITLGGSGDNRTLTFAQMGANNSVQVTCTVTQGGLDYVDTLTVLKVYDGTDASSNPDSTPPPTPSGLSVTSFTVTLLATWTAPVYTQGHGHDATIVYAAPVPSGGPQPTFANAVEVGSSTGNSFQLPADPGTRWAIWIKFQSRDGYKSTSPAGGTNGVQATAAQIGNVNLGPLIVQAGNLVDSAVTTPKIAPAALDATKFASTIQPVGIFSGAVPTTLTLRALYRTDDGKLYRWNGTAYTASTVAADITGQLTDAQIAALAAAKITGQITGTQIADGGITTPKLAAGSVTTAALAADSVTATQIAAGAVTASEIAANAVTANALAANSVIAGKIAAGAVTATEIAAGSITASKIAITGRGAALNDDPAGVDSTAWDRSYSGNAQFNIPSSLSPNGLVLRLTNVDGVFSRAFPIVTGKRYRVACWARQVSGNGAFYFRLRQYDTAGTLIAYSVGYEGITLSGTFARMVGTVDVAPSAVAAIIEIIGGYPSNVSVVDVADIRCEEVLPGELIVDGSITARKLFITGGGGAINDDPDTTDKTAWTYADTKFSIATVSDTPGVTTVIQSDVGVAAVVPLCRQFTFDPAKTYRVRCRARNVGGNGSFYLLVSLRDSGGSEINGDGSYWFYPASGIVPPGSFTQYEGRFGAGTAKTFPSNARTMACGAILNYVGNAGYMQVTDLLIEECVDSGVIVDGAITATKLAANSIAVGTAAIQNGAIINAMIANAAIDNAKIANLQVDKLTAGTLGADIDVGTGKITFNNGAVMRVMGIGFGSSNQFIEWFGPALSSLTLCTEANARSYKKTNGDEYMGGSLSAGHLFNSISTSDLSANAQVAITFGTNGNSKVAVFSYNYQASKSVPGGGGGNSSGSISATIRIYRKIGSAAETTWTNLNVTGNYSVDTDVGGPSNYFEAMSGSVTLTDSDPSASDRTYRAEIISRSLFFSDGGRTQTITITSTEQ